MLVEVLIGINVLLIIGIKYLEWKYPEVFRKEKLAEKPKETKNEASRKFVTKEPKKKEYVAAKHHVKEEMLLLKELEKPKVVPLDVEKLENEKKPVFTKVFLKEKVA